MEEETMRKFSIILFCISLLTLSSSCDFRPLAKVGNTHYVRVYIDEHIPNITEGFYNPEYDRPKYRRPEVMRVVLADPTNGKIAAERYLRNQGDDARGHYYDGYIICDPGQWSLLAWNFDTEATIVGNTSDIFQASAYTNLIAAHLYNGLWSRTKGKDIINGTKTDGTTTDEATTDGTKTDKATTDGTIADGTKTDDTKTDFNFDNEKIVYEPDHLFVAKEENVRIGYTGHIDTLRTPSGDHFTATSIVESWYIQVNVKGISRLTSSVSLMSGLSGKKMLVSGRLDDSSPVTVYFDMSSISVTKADEDNGVLYSTFSTFGKLPESENGFKVTFDMVANSGKAVSATFDVTEEFDKDIAKEHRWIILDRSIVIPEAPPSKPGGGFSPGVRDWSDVDTDLRI